MMNVKDQTKAKMTAMTISVKLKDKVTANFTTNVTGKEQWCSRVQGGGGGERHHGPRGKQPPAPPFPFFSNLF